MPEFRDIEVALTDISQHNLDMIKAILEKIVEANGFPVKVTADTDRRRALEGRNISSAACGSVVSKPMPTISVFR